MSKLSPVEYAERTLGVHLPWVEASSRLEQHAALGAEIATLRRQMREQKSKLSDRKLEVAAEMPSRDGYAAMKVTDQREALKRALADDPTCNEVETKIEELQSEVDIKSAELKHHELGLSVLSARMHELGGLLSFYSAAKQAEITRQHVGASQENATQS